MTIAQMTRSDTTRKKVAVIGSGVSGAACAWALRDAADVTLFEAEARPGGHTATVNIDYDGAPIAVDTGFIVYNELTYPDLTQLFAYLGIATHDSDMGFSLSLDGGKLEWGGESLRTVFAQPRNAVSPSFLWMLREILRFNRVCIEDRDSGRLQGRSIGDYLRERRFSAGFRDNYLIPVAAAIWSTPSAKMLDYPASSFVTFFDNHRLIHDERPVWKTVTGGSRTYLDRLLEPLQGKVRLGAKVESVIRDAFGVSVGAEGALAERFDDVVIAAHSDQALSMLADPSQAETAILGAIGYRPNRVVLHRDVRLMPKNRATWSAWNYLRSSKDESSSEVSVTYWMNRLQGIDPARPLFVTLNPSVEPREELVFGEWSFAHPQFDARAVSAQARMADIQGHRRTWFAGAWTGHGFHEDGLRSGLDVALALGGSVPWRASPAEPAEDLAMAAE